MPRDASGLYTLPAGNPVITNTVISSTWANTTLSDIAAQLNNVYTRDGLLGPTAPFKIVDGTVAAPGLAFNAEPGNGWFRPAAGQVSWANGGVPIEEINTGAATTKSFWNKNANGLTQLVLRNSNNGTPDRNGMVLGVNPGGDTFIRGLNEGTATLKDMNFQFGARYLFDKQILAPLITVSGGPVFQLGLSGTEPVLQFAAGWWWQWNTANGALTWNRNNSTSPQTVFHQSGDFYGGRDIYCDNGTTMAMITNAGSGARTLRFTADNWKLEWYNGSLTYHSAGSGQMLFQYDNGAANFRCYGNFTAGSVVPGAAGLNVQGYNTSGSTLWRVLLQGNPSWADLTLQVVHAQGVWAGFRMFSSIGLDFVMSGSVPQIKSDQGLVQLSGSASHLVGRPGDQFIHDNGAGNPEYIRNQGTTNLICGINGAGEFNWVIGPSDMRLKHDVALSRIDPLEVADALEYVEFHFGNTLPSEGFPQGVPIDDGRLHPIGLVAQQAQSVLPALVNDAGTYLALNAQELAITALYAVKKLLARVAALEAKA